MSLTLWKLRISYVVFNQQCVNLVHWKGEAQKSPLFWRFFGGFWFSQDHLLSRNSTRKPWNVIKSPMFTNTPCKSICLYNAPSMHTVDSKSSFPEDWGLKSPIKITNSISQGIIFVMLYIIGGHSRSPTVVNSTLVFKLLLTPCCSKKFCRQTKRLSWRPYPRT